MQAFERERKNMAGREREKEGEGEGEGGRERNRQRRDGGQREKKLERKKERLSGVRFQALLRCSCAFRLQVSRATLCPAEEFPPTLASIYRVVRVFF